MTKELQPFVIAAFFVSFAWYVLHAAPTTWLLDSAELTATTTALGISHPPGHPAFHLLAWPLQLLRYRSMWRVRCSPLSQWLCYPSGRLDWASFVLVLMRG